MKKTFLIALAVAASSAAFASIDHSQLVNVPFGGTGAIAGANLSQLETGETTFGNGVAGPTLVVADDFTLTQTETITALTFYSYITGGTAPSVTAINYGIGAAPIAGTGLTAASSFTNAFMSVGGQGVYRVTTGDFSGSTRRIQETTITGLNITLTAGTYWLSWNNTGTSFSPGLPNSLAVYGKNAVQDTGTGFVPLVNGNLGGVDMAFKITSSPVPEPASMAALGMGALALIRRRRNKKA